MCRSEILPSLSNCDPGQSDLAHLSPSSRSLIGIGTHLVALRLRQKYLRSNHQLSEEETINENTGPNCDPLRRLIMVCEEIYQPILLYFDESSGTARPADMPLSTAADHAEIHFRGARYVCTGIGLMFWDYLMLNGKNVGLRLYDFDLEPALESSRLLQASSNVVRDVLGFEVLLAPGADQAESDGAQAFGSSLFQPAGKNGGIDDCLLLLPWWHSSSYGFALDKGLVSF